MVFYTSEGLNGVSWPALVGKVIPEGSRGRCFGLGQFLSSIGAAAAGYFVNRVLALQQIARADRWALLFLCGFVALMLSVVSMLFIREQPVARESDKVDVRRSLRKMWQYLREDRWLRRVIIAQLTMSTASAVFVFLIVRVRQVVPEAGGMIGTFVVLQSVGSAVAALVGGLLVDKVGSWAAIRAASFAHILVLLAATVAGFGVGSLPLYFLAFFFMGFAAGASWWSFTAFMLDFASEERRPIYLAAGGILASVTVLSPLIAGALFEALLPEVVFGGAGVLAVVGFVLVWKLRQAVTSADAVTVASGAASP
ncbi:MAG: MFS transporter, partial [Anaerolineae bacterium]|nr:MFS transporter [Anaerolineae bacterium]